MSRELPDAPDPARAMALLWGDRDRTSRKGKHALSVNKIVKAAMELADASGIEALSMRKVAEALGVGTMSLYTYVPGKAELVDVMIDTVYAGIAAEGISRDGDWRQQLKALAAQDFNTYLRHPWLLEVPIGRAILGPGVAAHYELELSTIEGIGLTDVEMDAVVALVAGHAQASARRADETGQTVEHSGMTEQQWWEAHAPLLARFADPTRFPIASRVGTAAGTANDSAFAADGGFDFGIRRILDGIAALVDTRS